LVKKKSQKMMKLMKRRAKSAFTLLEICVALLLIGIIASIVGVKSKDLIDQHRFKNGIAALMTTLQEAQGIAVTYQIDLECNIFTKDGEKYFQIKADAPLMLVDRTCKILPKVRSFTLNDKKCDQTTLKIYSSGRIEPAAVIAFHKNEAEVQSGNCWIDLQRPLLIKLATAKPLPYREEMPE